MDVWNRHDKYWAKPYSTTPEYLQHKISNTCSSSAWRNKIFHRKKIMFYFTDISRNCLHTMVSRPSYLHKRSTRVVTLPSKLFQPLRIIQRQVILQFLSLENFNVIQTVSKYDRSALTFITHYTGFMKKGRRKTTWTISSHAKIFKKKKIMPVVRSTQTKS